MNNMVIYKENKDKKIIARGLLLPKDKVSRNNVLYDWDSVEKKHRKLKNKPMMFNHSIDSREKPLGHFTDSKIFLQRPEEKKWAKVWDKTTEENDGEEQPGWYYEADINPDAEYTDSILRGDLNKVSIQVTADEQKEESSDDGKSYTRAFIGDVLESSSVAVPGFEQTSMVIMGESFCLDKSCKKEAVDILKLDVPLFTRILEYFNEADLSDENLHNILANVIKLNESKANLGMSDYNSIITIKKDVREKELETGDVPSKIMLKKKDGTGPNPDCSKKEFKILDVIEIMSDEEASELLEKLIR